MRNLLCQYWQQGKKESLPFDCLFPTFLIPPNVFKVSLNFLFVTDWSTLNLYKVSLLKMGLISGEMKKCFASPLHD